MPNDALFMGMKVEVIIWSLGSTYPVTWGTRPPPRENPVCWGRRAGPERLDVDPMKRVVGDWCCCCCGNPRKPED